MSSLAAAGFVVFILLLFAGIYLSLFGLPGTILIFLDVLVYVLLTDHFQAVWKVLLFLMVLAILAEAVDFWASSTDIHEAMVTKGSLWGAAIGAGAGMIILTPVFWGPGIWGGFFLGGLAGLLITEWFHQSQLKSPDQATKSAFFAMIGQKMLKGFFSVVMIFVSLSNIYS
ncbi:hypothetical protein KN63_04905 [Smithella sp. F21]|nr:hypothetical protein KN63_04905 [Smithella sp. F21]